MMSILPITPGMTLVMKKPHPCGSERFRVVRAGSDIRMICLGCGRDLTLPRLSLEKKIRKTEE